jgi:hypothetical protein
VEPSPQAPLELREPRKPWRRVAHTAAGIAALAASLVIAVTLATKWVSGDRVGRGRSLSEDPISGRMEKYEPQVGRVAGPVEIASPDDRLAWDDPLDQQIALAAQRIVGVQQDWEQVEGAFGPLYVGLEEVAEELDQSPL